MAVYHHLNHGTIGPSSSHHDVVYYSRRVNGASLVSRDGDQPPRMSSLPTTLKQGTRLETAGRKATAYSASHGRGVTR